MEEEDDPSYLEKLSSKDKTSNGGVAGPDVVKQVSPTKTSSGDVASSGPEVEEHAVGLGAQEAVRKRKAHFRGKLLHWS